MQRVKDAVKQYLGACPSMPHLGHRSVHEEKVDYSSDVLPSFKFDGIRVIESSVSTGDDVRFDKI